jgi:hypothetical protein
MRAALAGALFVGACYGPTVATGVPCSSTRDCPEGQVCAANDHCELPGRDAAIDVLPIDAPPLSGWSRPKKLDELNTTSVETDPAITADGLDIVFASDRPGGMGSTDLYRAHRTKRNLPFDPPVLIAELNTTGSDQAAELSADGLTIYLIRPGAANADIFSAQRATRTSTFGLPVVLEMDLSSSDVDTNPAISRDGLVFSSTRGATDRELYICTREAPTKPWSTFRQLTEFTTAGVESGAAFDTEGLVVIFHSDRNQAFDMNDLFVAVRTNVKDPFGPATPMTELNTAMNESDATITADLQYIVYECESDLCYATR